MSLSDVSSAEVSLGRSFTSSPLESRPVNRWPQIHDASTHPERLSPLFPERWAPQAAPEATALLTPGRSCCKKAWLLEAATLEEIPALALKPHLHRITLRGQGYIKSAFNGNASWNNSFLLTPLLSHSPQRVAPADTALPGTRREVLRTGAQNRPLLNKIQQKLVSA